jgi:hypothetical protein
MAFNGVIFDFRVKCPVATTVYIDIYIPGFVNQYSYYDLAANSPTYSIDSGGSPYFGLDVSIQWIGDLGGYFYGTPFIADSGYCGSTNAYTGGTIDTGGEYLSNQNVSFTPTTGINQTYTLGSVYTSTPPC